MGSLRGQCQYFPHRTAARAKRWRLTSTPVWSAWAAHRGVYHLLRRDLGARPSYGRQKVGYGAEIADFVALSRDCRRGRARGLVQGIGDGAFPALPVPYAATTIAGCNRRRAAASFRRL